ncbi:MAG TPA: VOC family protein [Acidimicrobiales bacterium]|nr:VOC family protein [Acidimicrobiales bacterium]
MSTPSINGASHVALTVRDKDASAEWYQRVFGWQVLARLEAGQAGSPRVLLYDAGSGFALALCEPDDRSLDAFDHRRTGLDHLAFNLADAAEMDRWVAHLDDLGVAHSPVRDAAIGTFVSLEDPDGIQLELWLTA